MHRSIVRLLVCSFAVAFTLKRQADGVMLRALETAFPDGLRHEVRFPPARDGHRMEGSGLFVVNAPYGLAEELATLTSRFARLSKPQGKA